MAYTIRDEWDNDNQLDLNSIAEDERLSTLVGASGKFKLSTYGYNGNNPDRYFIKGPTASSENKYVDYHSHTFDYYHNGSPIYFLDEDYLNLPPIVNSDEGLVRRPTSDTSNEGDGRGYTFNNSYTCSGVHVEDSGWLRARGYSICKYTSEDNLKNDRNGVDLRTENCNIYIELQGSGGAPGFDSYVIPTWPCTYNDQDKTFTYSGSGFDTINIDTKKWTATVGGTTYYYSCDEHKDISNNITRIFRFYRDSEYKNILPLTQLSLWSSTSPSNIDITKCNWGFSNSSGKTPKYMGSGGGGGGGAFANLVLDLSKVDYIHLFVDVAGSVGYAGDTILEIYNAGLKYTLCAERGAAGINADFHYYNQQDLKDDGYMHIHTAVGVQDVDLRSRGGTFISDSSIIDGEYIKINGKVVGVLLTTINGGASGGGSSAIYKTVNGTSGYHVHDYNNPIAEELDSSKIRVFSKGTYIPVKNKNGEYSVPFIPTDLYLEGETKENADPNANRRTTVVYSEGDLNYVASGQGGLTLFGLNARIGWFGQGIAGKFPAYQTARNFGGSPKTTRVRLISEDYGLIQIWENFVTYDYGYKGFVLYSVNVGHEQTASS